MDRIILHWTAGGYLPSAEDRAHYHLLIDSAGRAHAGLHPISANAKPIRGAYAAHTLNCNTGSIGIAVCAMAGARERPFGKGRAPITPAQVEALVTEAARLCRGYGIPVTRQTVLSHAEVQPTLGIRQRGKRDYDWLPGMAPGPHDPRRVGDWLRAMVREAGADPLP